MHDNKINSTIKKNILMPDYIRNEIRSCPSDLSSWKKK